MVQCQGSTTHALRHLPNTPLPPSRHARGEGRGEEGRGACTCAIALGIVIHLISESNLHSELEVVFSLPVVFLEVTKGYPQLGYQEGPCAPTKWSTGHCVTSVNLSHTLLNTKLTHTTE